MTEGRMVIRPWGYAIWERLEAAIDQRIKAAGASNALGDDRVEALPTRAY
jgi:prolyl-tRNA synthetase